MNLDSNWKSLAFLECGQNYLFNTSTHEVLSLYTRKILKQYVYKDHLHVYFHENGKQYIYRIHQLVYAVHNNCWYDTKTMTIDHIDRNPQNNTIENLRLVPKHVNCINIRHMKQGNYFEYCDDIGEKEIINEYCKVYYSKTFKKFYRWVESEYRELHERKVKNNSYRISWRFKGKQFSFTTTDYEVIDRKI